MSEQDGHNVEQSDSSAARDQNFRDVLNKEYDRYSDLYKYSEDTGEKRLTFYISLVTAIVGAIVALYVKDDLTSQPNFALVNALVLMSLSGLIMIGYVIYNRLVKRNEDTSKYINNINNIRALLKQQSYTKDEITNYDFDSSFKPRPVFSKTNLKEIVFIINAFLCLFTLALYMYSIKNDYSNADCLVYCFGMLWKEIMEGMIIVIPVSFTISCIIPVKK